MLLNPGGNVTGLTFVTVELASKRIQLLKEAVPAAKRLAILWNPNNPLNELELYPVWVRSESTRIPAFSCPMVQAMRTIVGERPTTSIKF